MWHDSRSRCGTPRGQSCMGSPIGVTSYQSKTCPFSLPRVGRCGMRAVAGRRVGHVETIQTWRAAPCDYPPAYSACNNSKVSLSSTVVYFTLLEVHARRRPSLLEFYSVRVTYMPCQVSLKTAQQNSTSQCICNKEVQLCGSKEQS